MKPKTFEEAWAALLVELALGLRLDRVADWLAARISTGIERWSRW